MPEQPIVTDASQDVGRMYDRLGKEALERDADEGVAEFGLGENLHFGYWETADEDVSLIDASIRLSDVVIDRLHVDSSHHVLDIGCGNGGPALRTARRTGARVTGISVSQDQITRATALADAEGLAGQVDFRWADALSLPFPDNSFDAAFALESIVHMSDRRQVLSEISRILRPGGRLVLTDFFQRAPIPEAKRPVFKKFLDISMATTVPVEDYPPMLRDVGLLFEEIVDISENTNRRTFVEVSKLWPQPDLSPEEELQSPDPCPAMAKLDEFGYLLVVAQRS